MTFSKWSLSSALAPFLFWRWFGSASLPLGLNAMSSLRGASLRWSVSQYVSQRKGLWAWLRWGVCSAAGLWLGLTALVADQYGIYGNFDKSAQLFPYNRFIRTRPAYNAIATHGSLPVAVAGLQTDVWSADLTYGVATLYYLNQSVINFMTTAWLQRFKVSRTQLPPSSKGNPMIRSLGFALALLLGVTQAQAQSNFTMPPPAGVVLNGAQVVASCGAGTLITTNPGYISVDTTGKLCINATITTSSSASVSGTISTSPVVITPCD